MEAAFLQTMGMSLRASWVIMAVIVFRALLKRAPQKYAYRLWAVVGFRLCCPVSFQSAFSLFSLVGPATHPAASGNAIASTAPAGALSPAIGQLIQAGHIVQETETVKAASAVSNGWVPIAATLWCLGVLLFILWGIASYVRLSLRLRSAVRWAQGIYQSECAGTPFVMGFVRPRIYIPYHMSPDSLHYAIAHERCHIRRMDPLIKLFAYLLLAVHWMNPLCWAAFFLMNRDMEMSCDEDVLAREENAQSAYSATLLDVALSQRPAVSGPPAFGKRVLRARIRNALHWKKPSRWMTASAAVLCAAGLFFLAANPAERAGNPLNAAYRVISVEYSAPQYSFAYTPETAPSYWVGSDGSLWACGGGVEGWERLGKLEEVPLSAAGFSSAFEEGENFNQAAERLCRENRRAWQMSAGGVRYDLLQQDNGDLYLAYGYEEAEGSAQGNTVRWLFRLERRDAALYYMDAQHIYLSPLSSSWAEGSQYQYTLAPTSFAIQERASGRECFRCTGLTWAWQPLDDSAPPWDTEFMPDIGMPDISGYEQREVLVLSEEYSLLRLDAELWIVQYKENPQMGRYVWSIHALSKEMAHSA